MFKLIVEIGGVVAIIHFVFHVTLAAMGTDMAAFIAAIKAKL